MPAFLDRLAVRVSVCLALVVLGVIFAIGFRLPAHLVLQTGDSAYAAGPITSRAAFVQELNITGPARIASLEVLLATWGKPANTTHDEMRVFDGSGRQVQAMKLPPGTVADNAYVRVDLRKPLEIDGQGRFFVSLSSSDGSKADSITAWATHAAAVGRLYSLPGADLSQGSLVAKIDAARPLKGAICIQVLGQGPRRLLAEKALRVGGLLVFLALAACAWWSRLSSTSRLRHYLQKLFLIGLAILLLSNLTYMPVTLTLDGMRSLFKNDPLQTQLAAGNQDNQAIVALHESATNPGNSIVVTYTDPAAYAQSAFMFFWASYWLYPAKVYTAPTVAAAFVQGADSVLVVGAPEAVASASQNQPSYKPVYASGLATLFRNDGAQ